VTFINTFVATIGYISYFSSNSSSEHCSYIQANSFISSKISTDTCKQTAKTQLLSKVSLIAFAMSLDVPQQLFNRLAP